MPGPATQKAMRFVVAALTALVLSSSCAKAEGQNHGTHPGTAPTATTPTTPTPSTPPAVVPPGPLGVVQTEFEAIRADLAKDSAAGLAQSLERLKPAVEALTAAKHPQAQALATGIAALTASLPKDGAAIEVKAVRVAYGELARAVVAVIAADPALQAGRFLYECPMARGYKRWVELKPRMENPYMGSRMLECGSAIVAWGVEG